MRVFPVLLSRGLGILLGVIATTMAHGQQANAPRPPQDEVPPPRAVGAAPGAVHRMVIQEGPNRRVAYITSGNLAASDVQAAYNLERAENELIYTRDLQRLKQQYVNAERTLQPLRLYMQERLYGRRLSASSYGAQYSRGSYAYPYVGGYYGYPGGYFPFFTNGYGYGGYGYPGGVYGYLGSASYSEVQSLQYGMGDEGRMKNALVSVIAQEATANHAAAAVRDYDTAAAQAAASPVLSRDLKLPKPAAAPPSRGPSFNKGSKATIWLGNDKYTGTIKDDRPDWVVIQTDKGEVTVRKSEITRTEKPSKP